MRGNKKNSALKRALTKEKTKKYGNKSKKILTKFGEREFPSGLEASVYLALEKKEKEGILIIEKLQDTIYLGPARFRYTPDFKCTDTKDGSTFWVEAKGFKNDPTWRRNYRLWKIQGPGKLEVWYTEYRASETLIPKMGVCKECGRDFKEE